MSLNGKVVNADTVVMKVVSSDRELKSIKRQSKNRVPCMVLMNYGKHGRKTVDHCNSRWTVEQGVQLVANGMPRQENA